METINEKILLCVALNANPSDEESEGPLLIRSHYYMYSPPIVEDEKPSEAMKTVKSFFRPNENYIPGTFK